MRRPVRLLCLLLVLAMALGLAACGDSVSKTYDKAQTALAKGHYEEAAELFESIGSYEDASKLAMYAKALLYGEQGNYAKAIDTLDFLGDYKDSLQLAQYFEICTLAASTDFWAQLEAAEAFDAISAFRDSEARSAACRAAAYNEAKALYDAGDFYTARRVFASLGAFKDSAEQVLACDTVITERENAAAYAKAEELLAAKDYAKAIAAFTALGDYCDSAARLEEAKVAKNADDYAKAEELLAAKDFDGAIAAFTALGDYRDSASRLDEAKEGKNAEAYAVEAHTVTGLSLQTIPYKTVYLVGDYLDVTGLSLLLSYSDGDAEIVNSGFSIYPVRLESAGLQTVEISYQGWLCSFQVTVYEEIEYMKEALAKAAAKIEELEQQLAALEATKPIYDKMLINLIPLLNSESFSDALKDISAIIGVDTDTLVTIYDGWKNYDSLQAQLAQSKADYVEIEARLAEAEAGDFDDAESGGEA